MKAKGMTRPVFLWMVWSDNSSELIAQFQYMEDARRHIDRAKVTDHYAGEDTENAPYLMACDTYDGSLIIRKFKEE